MARAFTEEERTQIRQRLLDTGRELFTHFGLKKTSIEELTGPAGIAKSSFYLFFDSKEALFLELMVQDAPQIEERLLAATQDTDNMQETIARFLCATLHEIQTDALVRRLLTHPEELQMLARRLPPGFLEGKAQRSMRLILPLVQRGQERGDIIDGDPWVIAGVIRAATLLTLHEEEIGRDIYPEVLKLMIQVVSKGLTRE
jgi:AcrR family transcriptional regulator